jgi:hypothetical protein
VAESYFCTPSGVVHKWVNSCLSRAWSPDSDHSDHSPFGIRVSSGAAVASIVDRGKTVTKPLALSRLGLPFERKQIPQVVEKLENGDEPKEALERAVMRPRELHRFQRLHRFSPNPNNYNKLGNLLFARQSTQDASTDGVRAQFCHSAVQKPSKVSNASRYPMSIRHSSARAWKGRSQSAGGGTSSFGRSCVLRRSNVRRKASVQREVSREPDVMSR